MNGLVPRGPRGFSTASPRAERTVRGGWTLVEMSICITIGTIVFAAAVELLGFALRADSSGGRGTESFQSVDRLAEQFRSDVRSAIEVKSSAPAGAIASWNMKLPDGRRVEYAMADQSVVRTEYRADKVAQRDAFALANETVAHVELRPAENPAVAELVLDRFVDGAVSPSDSMRVAAAIGWDRRFAAPAKSPK